MAVADTKIQKCGQDHLAPCIPTDILNCNLMNNPGGDIAETVLCINL